MSKGGLYNVNPLALGDIFWFTSGATGAHLSENAAGISPLAGDTRSWLTIGFISILGFVAYRILIESWFRTENFVSGAAKIALDDALRWTTIFAVVQLFTGGSIFENSWINNTGLFVGSVVFYDLLANNFVVDRTKHLKPNVALGVQDVVKYGTVISLYTFLLGGSNAFDKRWFVTTVGWLIGIAIYDIFLAKHLIGDDGLYGKYIPQ